MAFPHVYAIACHSIELMVSLQAVNLTGPPPPEVLRCLAPPSEAWLGSHRLRSTNILTLYIYTYIYICDKMYIHTNNVYTYVYKNE